MRYFMYFEGKLKPAEDVKGIRALPNVSVLDDTTPTSLTVDVADGAVHQFLQHTRTLRGWVTSPLISLDLGG